MPRHGTSIRFVKDFAGRVAVITGGGGGIGRALAHAFAKRGMKIVIADVEAGPLESTARELREQRAEVTPVILDVRDRDAMRKLAEDVFAKYGNAHVLCNNAGVGRGGFIHELSLEDWDWVLDVNLRGVVYGIHHFLPRMLEGGEPCHIVNTASLAGLVANAGLGPYNATKYAVVAISETLAAECAGTHVGGIDTHHGKRTQRTAGPPIERPLSAQRGDGGGSQTARRGRHGPHPRGGANHCGHRKRVVVRPDAP
jgi:NAD(P)-dependent dehydrogenase (short-subunit alcohol dehydrogenase family)